MEEARVKHMVAWRDKKIKNLEERIKIYEEIVNMCLALCVAGQGERISKKRVREALQYKYDVSDDGEYYVIKRRQEEKVGAFGKKEGNEDHQGVT